MKLIKMFILLLFLVTVPTYSQQLTTPREFNEHLQVSARFTPKISYWTERGMADTFSLRRDDVSVFEITVVEEAFNYRTNFSSALELSLRMSELKKLKNGIEIPGIGTVYSSSGLRWRVEKNDPYLTRVIGSYHGGASLKQSYQWKDWSDLYRTTVEKPLKRKLTRFLTRFD